MSHSEKQKDGLLFEVSTLLNLLVCPQKGNSVSHLWSQTRGDYKIFFVSDVCSIHHVSPISSGITNLLTVSYLKEVPMENKRLCL